MLTPHLENFFFLSSGISRDHMCIPSCLILLCEHKEVTVTLISLAAHSLQLQRTSKSRSERSVLSDTPNFKHHRFSRDWNNESCCRWRASTSWTTEDHEISIVSSRDCCIAHPNLLPDL